MGVFVFLIAIDPSTTWVKIIDINFNDYFSIKTSNNSSKKKWTTLISLTNPSNLDYINGLIMKSIAETLQKNKQMMQIPVN